MDKIEREINDILDRGAVALEKTFRGKAIHVGIDWQRLYCDPLFDINQCGNVRMTQKILTALERMNETTQALRPYLPTAWVSHDIDWEHESVLPNEKLLQGLDRAQVTAKLREWRAEGGRLSGDVRPEDRVFVKQDFNAYSSPDFQDYLQKEKVFVHLLSGLVRTHCVKQTEHSGTQRGFSVFVMEDLTVDALCPYDDIRLAMYKDADRRGTKCVRSEDVKTIISQYKP